MRSARFSCSLAAMIHRHGRERSPAGTRDGSPIYRLRFIPLLLLGMLVLSTGCAPKQAPLSYVPEKPVVAAQSVDLVDAARKNIGIPYKFGGTTPETGFDCSGLVCWTYAQVGIQVPRTARDQFNFGERIEKTALKPGDIVVFKGTRSRTGWHSGIYTGEGKFIHSPTKGKAVMESGLDEKYFAQRFVGASRVPRDGSAATLFTAYQDEQRQAANNRRAGKSAPKTPKKTTLVADSGKSAKTAGQTAKQTTNGTSKQNAVAASSRSAGKRESTPLRTAAASSRQSGGSQADAVVDKLRAAKQQAPATRTQAGQQSPRQQRRSAGS